MTTSEPNTGFTIAYLPGAEPQLDRAEGRVEFIGGPRGGERSVLAALPETISDPSGGYLRSVACADDGALRYMWIGSGSAGTPGPSGG